MKKDLKEIKALSINEIKNKIRDARLELANLVLEKQRSTKGSKDVKLAIKKKKDIAQMLTILRQKQLLEELK